MSCEWRWNSADALLGPYAVVHRFDVRVGKECARIPELVNSPRIRIRLANYSHF